MKLIYHYFILGCLCLLLYWLFLNILWNSVSTRSVHPYLKTKKSTSYLDPPKKIFFYTDGINPHISHNSILNPEYEIQMYTPEQAADYVHQNCSLISSSYDVLIPHAFKADLFRYCALWNEGGKI